MKIDGLNTVGTGEINTANSQMTIQEATKKHAGSVIWQPNQNYISGQGMLSDNYTQAKSIEEFVQEVEGADLFENASMNYVADTMTTAEYKEALDAGYSLLKDEPQAVLTVTDKIQIEMAKGGSDMTYFGDDIPLEALEEVVGSAAYASQIQDAFKGAGLTMTENNEQGIKEALTMAAEVAAGGEEISEKAIAYLVKQSLSPTLENVYKATFSSVSYTQNTVEIDGQVTSMLQDLVRESAREDASALEDAAWMLKQEVPLTTQNLEYVKELKDITVFQTVGEVVDASLDAIALGGKATNAMLVQDNALLEQAKAAMATVEAATEAQIQYLEQNNEPLTIENLSKLQEGQYADFDEQTLILSDYDQVKAHRQLEEIRLSMTVEANYALLKKGIQLETQELSKVVEELKKTEQQMDAARLSGNGIEPTPENLDTYRNATDTLSYIKDSAAAVIGHREIMTQTLAQVKQTAESVNAAYAKAESRYETVMTAPRADMGDSITKAFRNVDAILAELDLESTPQNERAVRILGYNSMEITQENISAVKVTDAKVQLMLDRMKPSVVMEMIRSGDNPLTKTVDELNELAADILQDAENETAQKYSEYLWKVQQQGEMTDAQRDSYVGIYRLLNQISNQDGMLTGTLMQQGAALTMENYLMASRSMKKQGSEVTIDDNFGEVETSAAITNSISAQIESGYQELAAKQAFSQLQNNGPAILEGVANPMTLTPEQLLAQMKMQESETQNADYSYEEEQLAQAKECAQMEEGVYRLLDRYELPKTMYHLQAAHLIRQRNGKVFSQLFESTGLEADALEEVKQQILEEFGEAMKTPEDMAKAQEHLADVAEEAMSTEMENNEATSMSIRQIKMLNQAIKLGTKMSSEENYAVPVLVNGQMTKVQLKIVRASEERGKVAVSFADEVFGEVAGTFKVTSGKIAGQIAVENEASKEWMEKVLEQFADSLDTDCTLQTVVSSKIDSDAILDSAGENDLALKDHEVLTSSLYRLAKSFLEAVRD
ncbi:DUF6240 domain-containing protein [Eubacterium oxidoreducens]|uniref:Uncharacterized protein n=1 Tax=Eubacterium oxidoreducens TaxID=1732 RepID=A0A1G6CIK0_EUBOX|nr:DUF6240 domain-containing protein [Eubacterium oxidoreducens]SDB32694.1 hypothetical protein SAMN02910417_02423 [Eubacterium oxidoreducens]